MGGEGGGGHMESGFCIHDILVGAQMREWNKESRGSWREGGREGKRQDGRGELMGF